MRRGAELAHAAVAVAVAAAVSHDTTTNVVQRAPAVVDVSFGRPHTATQHT